MSEKRRKYRLAMLDDLTLREVFHFRVTMLGAISIITLTIIALIVLLSVLVVYTPLRNILPGYSASLRQQLVEESARVDSLQAELAVQRQYLGVIRQIAAGDIATDSVQRLDSMQTVLSRVQAADPYSETTDAFLAQYEQNERDRLLLFDNTANRSIRRFYRPVRGAVMTPARPDLHQYATTIRTAKNENVLAVARGTIVSAERMVDNTFTMILQAGTYMAVYRHVARPLKMQGTQVEAGESIAMMDGENELAFELWESGQFIRFEEVMAW